MSITSEFILALKHYGVNLFFIFIRIQRSPVTIGEAIMKVEDLFKKDKSFEKALKRMEENLVKGRKRKYRVSVA